MDKIGTYVWIRDKKESYIPYYVQGNTSDKFNCKNFESNQIKSFSTKDINEGTSVNESTLHENFENLIYLPEFSDASILYQLRSKYRKDKIYTYIGEILISVNPFKNIPYDIKDFITPINSLEDIDPNVYSIANNLYWKLMEENKSKSVIISGESGSGKTEVNKMILNLITLIDKSGDDLKTVILQSNPILEAFGNAKTGRNENSSRFGKWQELYISEQKQISGFSIVNYLLEKSRIISPGKGERNYHIFYSLFNSPLAEKYKLTDPNDFKILSSGRTIETTGWDDKSCNKECSLALKSFGFEDEEINSIWKALIAILNLGNIEFGLNAEEESSYVLNKDVVEVAAECLGTTSENIEEAITCRIVSILNERTKCPLLPENAQKNTDTLCKTIYSVLFDYLVYRINKKGNKPSLKDSVFFGTLDIFGFEVFKKNSLEQFCINWTNEKLQHNFNKFIVNYEKTEFDREGITVSEIKFVSNKGCINLIEGKGSSIISAVNDESTVPQGNDKQLLGKLKDSFKGNKYFEKTLKDSFIVKHYAENVEYTVDGFVYKNSDKIPESFTNLLEASTVSLIQRMFNEEKGGEFVKLHDLKDNTKKRPILHKFKRNLSKLIDRINDTDPYFIKCIKPNDQKAPDMFSSPKVLEQLRCAGLNELLRLRKSNYPHRFKFTDFIGRFSLILQNYTFNKNALNEDLKEDVLKITEHIKNDDYKIGVTKIMCTDDSLSELNTVKEEKMKIYLEAIIAYCKCVSAKLITEASLNIYKQIIENINTENYTELQTVIKKAQTSNINFFKLTVASKLTKIYQAFNEEDYELLECEINVSDNNLKKELEPLTLMKKSKQILELKSIIEEYNSISLEDREINIELLNEIKLKQKVKIETLSTLIKESNTVFTFSNFIINCIDAYEKSNIEIILKEVNNLDDSIKQHYQNHLIYKISKALTEIYTAFTADLENNLEGIEIYTESLNAILLNSKLDVIEKFPIFINSNLVNKIFNNMSDNNVAELKTKIKEYNDIKESSPKNSRIKEEILVMADYILEMNEQVETVKEKEEAEKIKTELLEKKFKINCALIEKINKKIKVIIDAAAVVIPEIPIIEESVDKTKETIEEEQPVSNVMSQDQDEKLEDHIKLEIRDDVDMDKIAIARASNVLKLPIKEVDSTISTDPTEGDNLELDDALKESFDRKAAENVVKSNIIEKKKVPTKSKKVKIKIEEKKTPTATKPIEEFIFPIFKGIKAGEIFDYDFPGYVDYSDSVEKLSNSFQFQTCRLLRLPENYSKKHSLQFLGFNAEVAHTFLFYSSKPIPRSLVKFNAAYVGDKHTAKAVKLEAPKLFGMLLQAENMFVNSLDIISSAKLTDFDLKSSKDPRFTSFYNSTKNILKVIVQLCRNQPLLHDEIFCQLIKQTTKNPSPASLFFYWALMLSIVTAIRPSAQLSSFLAAHCVRSFRAKGIIRYGTMAELATNVFMIMKEYKEGIREPNMPPFYLFKYTLFKDALYKISVDIHFAYLEENKKPLRLSLNQVSGELVEDLIPRVFSYFISKETNTNKYHALFTLKLKFSDEEGKYTEMIKSLDAMFNLLVYKKIPIIDIIQFITKEVKDVQGLEFKFIFVLYRTVPEDLEIESTSLKMPWEMLRYTYSTLKYMYEKEAKLNMNDKQIASIVMLSLVEKKKGKRLNSNDILHLDDDELLNLIPENYRERLEFHSWQSLIFKAATEIKFRKKIILNQQDIMVEFIKIISKSPEYALNEYYVCFKNSSKFKVKTWYILAFNWYMLVFKESDGTTIAKHLLKGISEVSFDKENHNLKFAIKEKAKTVVSLYCDIEVFNKLNTFRRYIPPSNIL